MHASTEPLPAALTTDWLDAACGEDLAFEWDERPAMNPRPLVAKS